MIFPREGDYVLNLSRNFSGRVVTLDGFVAVCKKADGTTERRARAELERPIGAHWLAVALEFAWFPHVGTRAKERARNAASAFYLDDRIEVALAMRTSLEILNRDDYRLGQGVGRVPAPVGGFPIVRVEEIAEMVAKGVVLWKEARQ